MSELDNAINSINASATKASKTASFLDQLGTYDENSNVTNPNNGAVVPSLRKQVKTRSDELFSEAETSINEAVNTVNGAVKYAGEFSSGVTSAVAGNSYKFDDSYWICLVNTTSDPSYEDANWRRIVSDSDIKASEERSQGVGISIYRGTGTTNGQRHVQNGDVVPAKTPPYTHLAVVINGKVENVAMSPVASGAVSLLTDSSATIGGTPVTLYVFRNGGYQATNIQLQSITPRLGEQWFNTTDNSIHIGDGVTLGGIKQTNGVNVKNYGAKGDGITDDTAAIQSVVDLGLPVFIPQGTYIINGTLDLESGSKLYGQGIGKSILLKTGVGHTIDAITSTEKSGIELVGLTIDSNGIESCFQAQYVKNLSLRYCEFKNSAFWLVNIGNLTSTSSDIVNSQIEIIGCSFNNITATYEEILIFNAEDVVIRDCYFENAPNGNGLGFWQNVERADVVNCQFSNMSTGAYYSLSTNNIRFIGCNFENCVSGLKGANLSDNGAFGATHANNISILGCTFYQNTGTPCQFGAVNGGLLSNSVFEENSTMGMLVDDGAIIGASAAQCFNISISNCQFINNNASNTSSQNAPGIRFSAIGGDIGATITGCVFTDTRGTPQQLYPITFLDAFTYNDVVISNCVLNAYSGALSVGNAGGATFGDTVIAVDNAAMTATIASGIKRRDARAMWQDFGTNYVKLESSSAEALVRITANTGNGAFLDLGNSADEDGGRIVYDSANNLEFYTNSVPRARFESGGNFRPSSDNTYTLGTASNRWSEVFAATGTINTSDERLKQDVQDLSDSEKAVALKLKSHVKKFRYIDAVQAKGDDARIHIGVMAQEVVNAFLSEGLDPFKYGIVCIDKWDDIYDIRYHEIESLDEEGNPTGEVELQEEKYLATPAGERFGIRYSELFMFIIAVS